MVLFNSIFINMTLKMPTMRLLTNNIIKKQPQGTEYLVYKQNKELKNILFVSINVYF